MGDDLKKVRRGEPLRIPARAYNRFIDAARAQRESAHVFTRMPGAGNLPGGTVMAFNAASEDAPMHGLVELKPTGQTQRQVEFVKPGAPGGAGVYGIAVEPVPSGAMGVVACSGGPWPLLVDDPGVAASPGRTCGPDMRSGNGVTPSWSATAGSAVFVTVREAQEQADGTRLALARFHHTGGIYQVTEVGDGTCTVGRPDSTGYVIPGTEIEGVLYDASRQPMAGDRGILTETADSHLFFFDRGLSRIVCPLNWRIVHDEGSGESSVVFRLTRIGGFWVRTAFSWMLWKFDEPLRVGKGSRLMVEVPMYAAITRYQSPSGEGVFREAVIGYGSTRIILEDFDLAGLTYQQLKDLDADVTNHLLMFQVAPNPYNDIDQDVGRGQLRTQWSDELVYGFALNPPAGATIHGEPEGGDYLECRFSPIYGYYAEPDLYYPRAKCWLLEDTETYR